MQNANLFLVTRYYQVQEHRIALGNQVAAMTEHNQNAAIIKGYYKRFYEIEKDIVKDLKTATADHIMSDWLDDVKGIGPILKAALLFTIDIRKAQHASSIWKYAGLDVAPDGRGRGKFKEHLVKKEYENEKGQIKKTVGITFNPFLKMTCWKISESFIKQKKSPYRQVYLTSKALYQKRDPKMSKMHCHNRAKRKAVKLFLSHFWAEWRKKEGLPVSEPFAHRS